MPTVSIVVIGKNEEQFIGQSLRAALEAADAIGGAEVVYVDSASTDRTVEIALSLGVRVLSLRPEWKLTPAAGRHIGFHYTKGDLIVFIDGDTIIERGFLPEAIKFFQCVDVAGLAGWLDDADELGKRLPPFEKRNNAVRRAQWLRGGCSIYRRVALKQVGSFNPHLIVEEEADLAIRLARQNWRLLQIPVLMACHMRGWYAPSNIKRVIRTGRLAAIGRTLRYLINDGNGWRFCLLRLRATLFFLLLCAFMLLEIILWIEHQIFIGVPIIVFLAALTAVAIKKRSLLGPINYIITHSMVLIDLVIGLPRTVVKDPRDYPLNVIEYSSPAFSVQAIGSLPHNQQIEVKA